MRTRDKINHIKKANMLSESRTSLIKEGIDNKYSDKKTIVNAIYKIFKEEGVEGRYTDEHWGGVNKLTSVFKKYGIDYDLESSKYEHNDGINSQLPNAKVFVFSVKVMDKMGKTHILPLKVSCAFVGKTGTMTDGTYELTYYFMV